MIKILEPFQRKLPTNKVVAMKCVKIIEETSHMFGVEITTFKEIEFEDILFSKEEKQIEMFGETFTFISDDNETFWGKGGKEHFLKRIREQNLNPVALSDGTILEKDESGEALSPFIVFSKSDFESKNKLLMAHIVTELGIFKSVNDARKNGWNKPIELGEFCLTKKKIRFRIVE